jgi:hypothetical protein
MNEQKLSAHSKLFVAHPPQSISLKIGWSITPMTYGKEDKSQANMENIKQYLN